VYIHGSTELTSNLKAAVRFTDDRADIAINLNECKSASQVIDAVAHEVAHIILNNNQDDNPHAEKWAELRDIITQHYNE